MVCEKCGAELKDNAKFCTNCGEVVRDEQKSVVQECEKPKKFWQKTWFSLIMLFVFPPIGIALLWINKVFGRYVRIGISLFIGLTFFTAVMGDKDSDSGSKSAVSSTNVKSSSKVKQSSISKGISKVANLSGEEANELERIFNNIGIKEPKLTRSQDFDGMGTENKDYPKSKGFTIATEVEPNDKLFWALVNDNKLICVNYHGHKLYQEGKVLDSYKNYVIDFDTKYKLYDFIRNIIKDVAINPKSVDFPSFSDWKFGRDRNNHNIVVNSYVESKNAFNALVRQKFQFVFSPDGKKVIQYTIDGQTHRM